jgi:hypothetical protein
MEAKMKKNIITTFLIAIFCMAFQSNPAKADLVDVTVTNITNGVYFTPLLVSAHDSATHLYTIGTAASANLQAMAEGGDISGLSSDLGGADTDTIENPAAGLLAPGASTTANLDTAAGNTHLSIVSMLLPTNDGFVGLNGLELPATPGTYTYYLNGYDAGTEANNEVINGGGAPGVLGIPAAPGGDGGTGGTGVTTTEANSTVHLHRGNLGDTNAAGGVSDLDSTIHRWLNPVAKIVITVH